MYLVRDGSVVATYTSVKDALDNAYSGDELWIAQGVYEEGVIGVEEAVTMRVHPEATGNVTIVGELYLDEAGIRVSGYRPGADDIWLVVTGSEDYGVYVYWDNIVVEHVVAKDNQLDGISVYADHVVVEDCTIVNAPAGISVDQYSSYIVLRGCTITGAKLDGVWFPGDSMIVEDCVFEDCEGDTVDIASTHDNVTVSMVKVAGLWIAVPRPSGPAMSF